MTLLVIIAGLAWAWHRNAWRIAERRRNERARRAERLRQEQFLASRR